MKKYFGGNHLHKKRKSKRPLAFDKPLHLVLRLKPNLPSLFNPRETELRSLYKKIAFKHGVKLSALVFNHTHLHISLLAPDRKSYVNFIRETTSKTVLYFSQTTGIHFKDIFDNRPFTRIAGWNHDAHRLLDYMLKNEKESGLRQGSELTKPEMLSAQLSFFDLMN